MFKFRKWTMKALNCHLIFFFFLKKANARTITVQHTINTYML